MKKLHTESLGSAKHYGALIPLIQTNTIFWRKCANLLGNLRRQLHPWGFVDRKNQLKEATIYVNQALVDTRLPEQIKGELKAGIISEFQLQLS